MKSRLALTTMAAAAAVGLGADVMGREVPLIPREVFFGNPDRAMVRISPDGSRLSWLAPVDGVLNVWVAPIDDLDAAKAVTDDDNRGIRNYFWAYTNEHIVYLQDKGGDENWRVYSVNLTSGETKDLTPVEGVAARIENVSPEFPDEILVALNDRTAALHDVHRVNIETGERELVVENNEGFAGFITDNEYDVRMAMKMTPEGGMQVLEYSSEGGWSPFMDIAMEETMTTGPVALDSTGTILYYRDSRDRNTAALFEMNLDTGESRLLAEDENADIGSVMLHPTTNKVQAAASNYLRKEWTVLDPSIQEDLDYLRTVAKGEIEVTSRTDDDRHWIVAYLMDDGPVRYYHYDRDKGRARFLFTNRKDLEGLPLSPMNPVVITARDGLGLVSYYTLPAGTPKASVNGRVVPKDPVPMVLLVHGGPWARDQWGYNPLHQWLANRGYAVLSVNFRGSTGFGKRYVNAGNLEWAGKMHDDLIDAVNWAVDQGIADPGKVAIMGGSYGGYATLVGLTFTPEVFACGVDIVGPSSIVTLLNTIPPYWAPMIEMFTSRVGDHRTEEGRAFLESRSPLTFVDQIKRPLLIGQGANDPRVKQSESDQIVKAMEAKGIPVTYVLYPDEGHGFARPENNLSFFAITEAFLAENLGGRFEPIGDDFEGSSVSVPHGAEFVPGLTEALPSDGEAG